MSGRTIRLWAGAVVAVATLAGTHGLAYWLGGRETKKQASAWAQGLMAGAEMDALHGRMPGLKILANHADHIPPAEVKTYCTSTESLIGFIERNAARLREAGNDPKADQMERQVAEARKYLARLRRKGEKP